MLRALFTILLLIVFTVPAHALDMTQFKNIPVLDEGRVKPLDSFARAQLKKFHGRDHLKDQDADEWLAQALFDPAASVKNPVFRIENGNLRHSLGLDERNDFLYSFTEIVPGLKQTSTAVTALLQKDKKDLSKDDKDLLTIHDDAFAYTALMRSLSLLLPLNVDLPEKYKNYKRESLSFLDLKKLEQDLNVDIRTIVKSKGENIARYSEDEKRIAVLAFQLQLMSAAANGNDTLKIIPPQWAGDNGDWHAPWELLQKGEGSPQTAQILDSWRKMGLAYATNNEHSWTQSSAAALQNSLDMAPQKNLKWKLKTEILQNSFPPFDISTGFYALSFIAALGFFVFGSRSIYLAGGALLGTGALVHLIGISVRILLLARPPVGTLYESLVFVSLITVAISLFIEKSTKNGTGFLIGSLSGLALGLLSFSFAGDGDTMEMLTAVLNTNFWLATHVLCITIGYGWCVLTAVFAHLMLAARGLNIAKFKTTQSAFIIHTLAILALLFTAIGTILGGIWADQSWGRFWGWDPKENGALLIVLWLIWVLHGKLGNQLNEIKFLAALAFLNVIVGISWIGVNLLGVGLHSYGFVQGLFMGLGIFTIAEILLIAFLYRLNLKSVINA